MDGVGDGFGWGMAWAAAGDHSCGGVGGMGALYAVLAIPGVFLRARRGAWRERSSNVGVAGLPGGGFARRSGVGAIGEGGSPVVAGFAGFCCTVPGSVAAASWAPDLGGQGYE